MVGVIAWSRALHSPRTTSVKNSMSSGAVAISAETGAQILWYLAVGRHSDTQLRVR